MTVTRTEKFGISAAITTPFTKTGAVDTDLLTAHVKSVLDQGCVSVTLGGTTGEGPSLSRTETIAAYKALTAASIDPAKIVFGILQSALPDAIDVARAVSALGCKYVLVAPPHYFKGVSDAGQVVWFDQFLTAIADTGLKVILYHIPQITGAPITPDMVGEIIKAHPGMISGVKDSSGDWDNATTLLERFSDRFHILIGDERLLGEGIKRGASGAISGVANLAPGLLTPLLDGKEPDKNLTPLVNAILAYPVTPAVKTLLAHITDTPAWRRVRAPLVELDQGQYESITNAYDSLYESGNN